MNPINHLPPTTHLLSDKAVNCWQNNLETFLIISITQQKVENASLQSFAVFTLSNHINSFHFVVPLKHVYISCVYIWFIQSWLELWLWGIINQVSLVLMTTLYCQCIISLTVHSTLVQQPISQKTNYEAVNLKFICQFWAESGHLCCSVSMLQC